MSRTGELIERLTERLSPLGYAEHEADAFADVRYEAVLATACGTGRRIVCAVAGLPADVTDVRGAAGFVERIRQSLARVFAPGLPWPKRMGAYTVLLGGRDLCRRLNDREGLLVDTGGFHVNVMLGSVIVDVETPRTRCDNTWGLIDTGQAFPRIQEAVNDWVRSHSARGRYVQTTPGLHVHVA